MQSNAASNRAVERIGVSLLQRIKFTPRLSTIDRAHSYFGRAGYDSGNRIWCQMRVPGLGAFCLELAGQQLARESRGSISSCFTGVAQVDREACGEKTTMGHLTLHAGEKHDIPNADDYSEISRIYREVGGTKGVGFGISKCSLPCNFDITLVPVVPNRGL